MESELKSGPGTWVKDVCPVTVLTRASWRSGVRRCCPPGRWLAQLTQELSEKKEEAESAGRKEEATEQRGRAEQLAIRLREARYGRILKLCSSQAPLLFLPPS